MSYEDNQIAIKKGQAYNLAVASACAAGKQDDNEYIIKQYLRHLQFAALVQKATTEQLVTIVQNPTTIQLIKELDKSLGG